MACYTQEIAQWEEFDQITLTDASTAALEAHDTLMRPREEAIEQLLEAAKDMKCAYVGGYKGRTLQMSDILRKAIAAAEEAME
jgi:hypothetical protein